jgi:hypothetical protein
VNREADRAHADASPHGHGDFADQFAGVTRDHRGAQDLAASSIEGTLANSSASSSSTARSISDRGAVNVVTVLLGVGRRQAHVRDLRIGVRRPGEDERAGLLPRPARR